MGRAHDDRKIRSLARLEPGSLTVEPFEIGGHNPNGRWYALVKQGSAGLPALVAGFREKGTVNVITFPLLSIVGFKERELVVPAADEGEVPIADEAEVFEPVEVPVVSQFECQRKMQT